jgi:hypothetical protein
VRAGGAGEKQQEEKAFHSMTLNNHGRNGYLPPRR